MAKHIFKSPKLNLDQIAANGEFVFIRICSSETSFGK